MIRKIKNERQFFPERFRPFVCKLFVVGVHLVISLAALLHISAPAFAGSALAFEHKGESFERIRTIAKAYSIQGLKPSQAVIVLAKNELFFSAVMTGVRHVAKLTPYDISLVKTTEQDIGNSSGKIMFYAGAVELQGTTIDVEAFDGSQTAIADLANKIATKLVENHKKYIAPVSTPR